MAVTYYNNNLLANGINDAEGEESLYTTRSSTWLENKFNEMDEKIEEILAATSYTDLANKPKINGVELVDNKRSHYDLGIVDAVAITYEEYEALTDKDPNRIYIIKDE